jgi:hypothetical protein
LKSLNAILTNTLQPDQSPTNLACDSDKRESPSRRVSCVAFSARKTRTSRLPRYRPANGDPADQPHDASSVFVHDSRSVNLAIWNHDASVMLQQDVDVWSLGPFR